MSKIIKNLLVTLVIVLIASTQLPNCFCRAEEKNKEVDYSWFEKKIAGAMEGTPQDQIIEQKVKNPEILYFKSFPDMFLALDEKKIDYFACPSVTVMMNEQKYPNVQMLGNTMKNYDVSFILPMTENGQNLQKKVNTYIAKLKSSGELQRLVSYWLEQTDHNDAKVNIPSKGANGTITMATTSSLEPYSYIANGKNIGFEIEILARFCKDNQYGLVIKDMDFAGVLAGIASEKYDIGGCCISKTPEREKSVLFCDATYRQRVVPVVRKDAFEKKKVETESFISSFSLKNIKENIVSNFITESRWKIILNGIATTLAITALSIVFGTLLGYFICGLRRRKKGVLLQLSRFFIWLFQGLPVVVLLMIMFYIVFQGRMISGFVVAVISFSLNFAAYVAEVIRSGVEAIDKGQWEASYALGYNKKQTYLKFVLPQAARNFLPVYRGQIINLLKGTSVVGYIAIQDITKASDIIRSRTFKPFFPLILTAVVYFVLAFLIIRLLGIFDRKLVPNLKKRKVEKTALLKNLDYRNKQYFIKLGKEIGKNNSADEAKNTIIEVRELKKKYEKVEPLNGLNIDIKKGDVISIIGPSGKGKSTLLRCLNGLETADAGQILVDGINICEKGAKLTNLRQKMGMVFQSFNLFSHLSVIENVMKAPVELLNMDRQKAYDISMMFLTLVGLYSKRLSYPDELSGGQKQRVAIARALAMNPDILLLDEPTSALDQTMSGEVLSVIRKLAKAGMSMMIVTHELDFAKNVSNRVVYLDEGIVYEDGTPKEIFDNPKKIKTKQFVQNINSLELEVKKSTFDYYETTSELEEFILQNNSNEKLWNRVEFVFEESLLQCIFPYVEDDTEIKVVAYFKGFEGVLLKFVFEKASYNEKEAITDISAMMLKNMTKNYSLTKEDNCNSFNIEIN